MSDIKKLKECFTTARLDEKKSKKHKGLMYVGRNDDLAEEYIQKAKDNLGLCEVYKEKRFDYKLPEEWFYIMYYCALAISAKFGVESRSQRCTALFLKYLKENNIISYDDEFIDRIMVYIEIDKRTDVDERQDARYGPKVKSEEIINKYGSMMDMCRRCINQCEEVIFSDNKFQFPKELREEE